MCNAGGADYEYYPLLETGTLGQAELLRHKVTAIIYEIK